MPLVIAPQAPSCDVEVRTADGLRLDGWLFLPSNEAPRGLAVYLHGKDGQRSYALAGALETFLPRGFAVLAYDQRGHGTSQGRFTTYGAREVDDLKRAIDASGVSGPTVLVGESLGGAVALQAAAAGDPRIVTVVAAASFADLERIARELAGPLAKNEGFVEEVFAEAQSLAGFQIREISPRDAAARITIPVLLIHGLEDAFTAPDHSRQIFQSLRGPKRLVMVEGVGHPDVLQPASIWREIGAWVDGLQLRPGSDADRPDLPSSSACGRVPPGPPGT